MASNLELFLQQLLQPNTLQAPTALNEQIYATETVSHITSETVATQLNGAGAFVYQASDYWGTDVWGSFIWNGSLTGARWGEALWA